MSISSAFAWGATLVLAGGWLHARRAVSYARLHPELRSPLLRFRTPSSSPTVVKVMRRVLKRARARAALTRLAAGTHASGPSASRGPG